MKRTPRDYQRRASDAFDAAVRIYQSALIVHPTGTGKTVTVGDIVGRWCTLGNNVLLVAHRVELLDQAADKFNDELGYRPQVIQADRPLDYFEFQRRGRAYIGSIQTLSRGKRMELFKENPIDLLLIDECHHARAKSYVRIKDVLLAYNPNLKWGGVTATPNRTDKKALGLIFDTVADQIEIKDAVAAGWLVPPCEKKVVIDGIDFSEIKLTKNEAGEIDFDPGQLAARMQEERPLHAVTEPLLENCGDRKWIVFAAGVEHGKRIAQILNRARPGCAESIDGVTHPPGDTERIRILHDFCNPDHPMQFVVNFGILTEGTDLPLCAGVCIARPTKSKTVLVQMIGRALRPLDGLVDQFSEPGLRVQAISESEKKNALILYFIPKTVNVRVLTVVDALGGDYEEEVTAIASDLTHEEPGANVLKKLRQAMLIAELFKDETRRQNEAKKEAERKRQEELAKHIKAKARYRMDDVDGYRQENASQLKHVPGMATEKQVAILTGLGVPYQVAVTYSSKQAFAVTDSIRAKRCTDKQRALLMKYGENPNVPYAEASVIITKIAANGWKKVRA